MGDQQVMRRVPDAGDLLHGLVSLNVLLLAVFLVVFLLAKLLALLHRPGTAASDDTTRGHHGRVDAGIDGEGDERREEEALFWFDEAVLEDSALLGLADQEKDHHHHHLYSSSSEAGNTAAAHCVQVAQESCAAFKPAAESRSSTGRISISPHEERQCDDDDATTGLKEQRDAAVDGDEVPMAAPVRQNLPAAATTVPENASVQEKEGSRVRGDDPVPDSGGHGEETEEAEEDQEKGAGAVGYSSSEVKLFVNRRAIADTRKLLPECGGAATRARREKEEEEDYGGDDSCRFGASTLTSESTSKSSVEWQMMGSTVGKDCYPFSSSSRRSSARWESYTLFRKYDEDMVYFHRVGAQKLTETESFRSIKYQPRSMSQRITHKLSMAAAPAMAKPGIGGDPVPIGLRDPYPELERAYVAQICLTWEALNWNYTTFRRHNNSNGNNGNGGGTTMVEEARCCPARVAQEFQQFQVLLHRFIENEPYDSSFHGQRRRRPEVYARMKNSSPKLLLVPEFREEEDEKDDLISAAQFLHILEESIRTFMAFLRADKRSHYQMFRDMVRRRRTNATDQALIIDALKKSNSRKKSRLKDLTRPRRCLRRTKLREEEEMSVLLGLIDLKVVARVLRMPEVTDQQLHWCEEKMNRLRVDIRDGSLHRDPAPLFFPAH